jgi:hypothetical protein
MKTLLTEAEARALLDAHTSDVRACLLAGWAAWTELGELVPHHRINLGSRSRASIVHDAITAEARKRFHNRPGVNVLKQHGFLVLVFDGRLVLRFKKLDDRFRTAGIATRQRMRFEYQMHLEGLDAQTTNVVAGYLLTQLQDEYQGMWIVCSDGGDLQWKVSLVPSMPATLASATAPSEPPAPKVRPVAKPQEKSKEAN